MPVRELIARSNNVSFWVAAKVFLFQPRSFGLTSTGRYSALRTQRAAQPSSNG
jgi:hypothetical protein